jgi:energy-coupling factor transporter ATP-binding protein EcfA2
MLDRFIIKGLFGEKNIDIDFGNDSVILTGDNGFGKTTILNILYNLLVGNVNELIEYDFDKATVILNREFKSIEEISVIKRKEKNVTSLLFRYFFGYDGNFDEKVVFCPKFEKDNYIRVFIFDSYEQYNDFYLDEKHLGFQFDYHETILDLSKEMGESALYRGVKKLNKSILYFPTYRRIDLELSEYMKNRSSNRRYNELKIDEFNNFSDRDRRVVGISNEDVSNILRDYSQEINEVTSKSLNNLMKNFVKKFIVSIIEEDERTAVMNVSLSKSLEEETFKKLTNLNNILSLDIDKGKIEEFSNSYSKKNEELLSLLNTPNITGDSANTLMSILKNSAPWISYLEILEQLIEEYQVKLKKVLYSFDYINRNIRDFTNRKIYLKNNSNGDIDIIKNEKIVSFKKLSTGEKQIFTFFVYCAMSLPSNNSIPSLVIIDEPELSLHVKWQTKLLTSILEKQNIKVFSATHSPYILRDVKNNSIKALSLKGDDYAR